MSNDTMVTVQGWVGGTPVMRTVGGYPVTNFRVACTPRRFHRGRQEWVDGQTQWYSVSAWRTLGTNCAHSLRRGDPVIVHGRLQQRSYSNAEGVEVVTMEIEALTVGHDLTRGIDSFVKAPAKPQPAIASEAPAQAPSEDPFGGSIPRPEAAPATERAVDAA